jgi:hypothetical protein
MLRTFLFATARLSACLFLGAFTGEAIARLRPGASWLAERRRGFTLAFVVSHSVHLAFIVTLVASYTEKFNREANPVLSALGLVLYGLIYALGLVELFRLAPAKNVERFRTVAHWIVQGALARPIVTRAIEGRSPAFYVPAALIFLVAFGVRIAAAFARESHTRDLAPERSQVGACR